MGVSPSSPFPAVVLKHGRPPGCGWQVGWGGSRRDAPRCSRPDIPPGCVWGCVWGSHLLLGGVFILRGSQNDPVTCQGWKWKLEISCPVPFDFQLLRRGRGGDVGAVWGGHTPHKPILGGLSPVPGGMRRGRLPLGWMSSALAGVGKKRGNKMGNALRNLSFVLEDVKNPPCAASGDPRERRGQLWA